MPNPLAHPAAAIPFARVGLVFSALVAGSISPDFGYFVPLTTPYFMYTLSGLLLFDVPVGLVLLWLFHILIKWPLLSLLPINLQRRLSGPAQGFSFGPPKRFILILGSLLVGSLTHIIWDSFTHEYGWMARQFAFLRIPIHGMPLYTILQNLGTILGIGLLINWFMRWLPTAPQSDQLPSRFSGKVQMIFFALASVSFAAAEGTLIYVRLMIEARFISWHFLIYSIIISTVLIFSFLGGIYCMAWRIAFHRTVLTGNISSRN
ncbi:MAG TPA: DUF4184 family protein [Anaerolineales bacterium]|nr:DUF4184 family protein [Anaerolineales bacterium]